MVYVIIKKYTNYYGSQLMCCDESSKKENAKIIIQTKKDKKWN